MEINDLLINRRNLDAPVVRGIYFLFREGALVYVGKSSDVYKRVRAHRANGREFDFASVMLVQDAHLGWVEKAVITAMRPPANTKHAGNRKGSFIANDIDGDDAPKVETSPSTAPSRRAVTSLQMALRRTEKTGTMSKTDSRSYASSRFHGGGKMFDAALKAGEIPTIDTGRRGNGANHILIPFQDLVSWTETQLHQSRKDQLK